jgi:hypothetical protein
MIGFHGRNWCNNGIFRTLLVLQQDNPLSGGLQSQQLVTIRTCDPFVVFRTSSYCWPKHLPL